MNKPEDLPGLLRDLGDDGGRPLPKSAEERLALARSADRRRKTGLVAAAGVTAAVLALGATALPQLMRDPVVDVVPAAPSPRSSAASASPTGAPTGSPGLSAEPLLGVSDMPEIQVADESPDTTAMRWEPRSVTATEGECEAVLSSRPGYAHGAFAGGDAQFAATGKTMMVVNYAGQETSPAEAQRVFARTVSERATCAANPDGQDKRTVTSADVGDESRVWRVDRPCTPPTVAKCEPSSAYAGLARVGRVLVSVSFSVTGPAGDLFPVGATDEVVQIEGKRLLDAATAKAVAR